MDSTDLKVLFLYHPFLPTVVLQQSPFSSCTTSTTTHSLLLARLHSSLLPYLPLNLPVELQFIYSFYIYLLNTY